jgi:serine/threonine protein kinase
MSQPVRSVEPLRNTDPPRLGGHRLLGRLGAGGMGVVYLAEGPSGLVAIKVVRDELSSDPGFRTRFQREVRACFLVSGEWTARLVDFDVASNPPWLATEFIDAPDLQEVIERHGPFGGQAQIRLAHDLARGLASLHARGLVHRDLKPSNVLSPPEGLRIIDFGIASAVEDIGSLTATANVVGSPAWMAPEQILDGQSGMASDVYAWGALVVFSATGRPLVEGRNIHQIMNSALSLDVTGSIERVHEPLRPLVAAALNADPAQRPTSAELVERVAPLDEPPNRTPGAATQVLTSGDGLLDRTVVEQRTGGGSRGRLLIAAAVAGVAAIGAVIAIVVATSGSKNHSGSSGVAGTGPGTFSSSRAPVTSAPAPSTAATDQTPDPVATGGAQASPLIAAFRPVSSYDHLVSRIPASIRPTCTPTNPPTPNETDCRVDLPNGDRVNVIYTGFTSAAALAGSVSGDKVPGGCQKGLSTFSTANRDGSYLNPYVDGRHYGQASCQFVSNAKPASRYSNISWTDNYLSLQGFISNESGTEPAYQRLYQDWLQVRHVN